MFDHRLDCSWGEKRIQLGGDQLTIPFQYSSLFDETSCFPRIPSRISVILRLVLIHLSFYLIPSALSILFYFIFFISQVSF